MRKTWERLVTIGSLTLLVACGGDGEPASQQSMTTALLPVPPSTSINAVMVGLVDHASHHLWDLSLEEMAPESEADWEEVEHHAIQLIAGGTYITVGGTGVLDANWVQQAGWQAFAQDVSDAGVAAYDAALRRDLNGVLSAGDSLILACEGCHEEYKPALPTEGIMHPHHD
jgi:hypothetical protein